METKKLSGVGIVPQTTFGRLHFHKKVAIKIENTRVSDTEAEEKMYQAAKEKAITQLQALYEKALRDVGEEEAMIFEVHQMMLGDDDYNDDIVAQIKAERTNASFAVENTKHKFAQMFRSMDDEYMQGRAADVLDISDRIINILNGKSGDFVFEEPVVLSAEDLTPSETIQMDKEKVLAFVTTGGSKSSHTAILARMLGIPAIIGMPQEIETYHGKFIAVDGDTGNVFIEPDEEIVTALKEKQKTQQQRIKLLNELKGKANRTKAGHKIDIYANIGSVSDVEMAQANDAGGIGLFRSEFLYLSAEGYPSEQMQFEAYKKVLEQMNGKRVVIRTLDIGADKQIDYFDLPKEENPALGLRAIRICLTRPDIFKTQLRALLRASVYGKLAIMFPMIISVKEVQEIKKILEEVKCELTQSGINFSESIEIGIMIETPAAALISDRLAKEVDFFSIGTNDLTGYTLAIDRQNLSLARFDDPHHEALLRLIEMTVKNAHKEGKWVGICGELGADLSLTEFFLEIGVDELSVSPPYVLPLREKVRSL